MYIYPFAIHIAHACATGKHNCKFKGCTFLANLFAASNSANACSLSTTDHPCAWMVPTSADRTSPHETTTMLYIVYGESYTHIAIQRACCPPVYSLLNVPCLLIHDLKCVHVYFDPTKPITSAKNNSSATLLIVLRPFCWR